MSTIEVNYWRNQYVTAKADPEDDWDRDNTAADWGINSISVKDKNGYRDLTVNFDIEEDVPYYLVVADYGTGDSFGRDDNQLEFIDLFQDEDTAWKARKEIMAAKDYTAHWTRDDGSRASCSCPWEGYFEHLNDITIHKVYRDKDYE